MSKGKLIPNFIPSGLELKTIEDGRFAGVIFHYDLKDNVAFPADGLFVTSLTPEMARDLGQALIQFYEMSLLTGPQTH